MIRGAVLQRCTGPLRRGTRSASGDSGAGPLFTSTHVEMYPTVSSGNTKTYRVAPSDYLLDSIGDVINSNPGGKVGTVVEAGQPLFTLDWEGYYRSASDELYHAIWENTEGSKHAVLACSATIVEVNETPENGSNWLVAVELCDDFHDPTVDCMDSKAYDDYCNWLDYGGEEEEGR